MHWELLQMPAEETGSLLEEGGGAAAPAAAVVANAAARGLLMARTAEHAATSELRLLPKSYNRYL